MNQAIELSASALEMTMPMYALVSKTGHIFQAGPTMQKLFPQLAQNSLRFLEAFELRSPRAISSISELIALGPQSMNLRLRGHEDLRMKGVSLPLSSDTGLLINLSFGISVAEAVRRFNLSSGDFAPTDLAIEMLYLIVANDAVTAESRNLQMRLLGAKSAAEEKAFTDTLTGLKNRRAMDVILARYQSCGERFALMHLDLDHFKAVNDTLGHAAGDAVLVEAARILTEETRAEDAIIRTGGDEFVLIFHGLTESKAIAGIADRILNRLKQPIPFEGELCHISGSIGVTVSDDYAEVDPEQMMVDADVALYAAKKAGRAQYRFIREAGGAGQSAASLAAAEPLDRAQA